MQQLSAIITSIIFGLTSICLEASCSMQADTIGQEGESPSLSPFHIYNVHPSSFEWDLTTNPEISVNNVSLSFEKKRLFDDLDFSLVSGDKVTIVGENGCGKTTFLRLLNGLDYPYLGSIVVKGRIAFLPQHFEEIASEKPAIITLLTSLNNPEVNLFLKQPYETFSSEWYHELNSLGLHEIFRQANLIGLENDLLEKPFKQLSGGEKTKIMLCALSTVESDFILLDEPTNHLDIKGIKWLENFLQHYEGGIVMVTHDRSLINAVSNRISELSPYTKKFVHFKGGYDNFLAEEEKKRQRTLQERHHQDKELKKLKQQSTEIKGTIKGRIIKGLTGEKTPYYMKEQRAQKSTTRAFKKVSQKQEDLTDNLVDIIPERKKILFNFDDDIASSSPSLSIDISHITKSYEEPLFHDVSFTLVNGDRLIIQGPNGSGKSTLMRIIMGLTQADEGSVNISRNAVIGYLDQEQENMPLDKSAVTILMEDPLIKASKKEAINNLCDFGVYTWHDLTSPIKTLSIGCRRKVQFCQIIMRKSSILLLDEPTNHIDFLSLEAIEEALLTFPGIIIAATHDRYFTEKLGTKALNLSDFKPTSS
jgi:ATPase subunit of ABC transporter with duplicated ATPase domains